MRGEGKGERGKGGRRKMKGGRNEVEKEGGGEERIKKWERRER